MTVQSMGHSRKVRHCLSRLATMLPLLLVMLPVAALPARADGILYVDASADGANSGTSWEDAYTDVQQALTAASSGEQIWVANGIYTPGSSRDDSFALKTGVVVYGGFTGDETAVAQRNPDPSSNGAVLSGDLNRDDVDSDGDGSIDSNNEENSYHVVTGSGIDSSAVLDGFTITGGNANSSSNSTDRDGGGIHNRTSSPTLRNLIISGNRAEINGGGIANFSSSPNLGNLIVVNNSASFGGGGGMYNDESNPTLSNLTIRDNTAFSGGGIFNSSANPIGMNLAISGNGAAEGGGITNSGANPMFTNLIISGNGATRGGGISNSSSEPVLTNLTVSGNHAEEGGGIYNSASSPTFENSIIWGNAADVGSQLFNTNDSQPRIQFTLVEGGISGSGVVNADPSSSVIDGGNNLDADPRFVAPKEASKAPSNAGNYRLQTGSPAIDRGDNALNSTATDLDGGPRIVDSTIDLGAYEFPGVPETHVYLPLVLNAAADARIRTPNACMRAGCDMQQVGRAPFEHGHLNGEKEVRQ